MPTRSVETEQEVERMGLEAEKRFRRIFYASIALSTLIVLYIFFVSRYVVPLKVRVPLAPMLLWSLVVTCYAFYSLWDLIRERTEKMKEMSEHDSITTAYTETYLRRHLRDFLDAPASAGGRGVLTYLRFAGIKEVNLQYGYTVGNVVLRELVERAEQNLPEQGFVARLGGMEFAVVMPAAGQDRADQWLSQLTERVQEYVLDLGERGSITGLTVALGTAAYPDEGRGVEELAGAARDRAVDRT